MFFERGKAKPFGFEAFNQGLEHRRRPRVLARPNAQMRHQNFARADVVQGALLQHGIGEFIAGQLVTQKPRIGPAHMGKAALLGCSQQRRGCFTAWRAEQRQRLHARNLF